MIKNNISGKKLFIMLSTELFALTSLILPSILVGFAGTKGLLVLLASSGLLLLLAVFYTNLAGWERKSPDFLLREIKNRFIRDGMKGIYILRFFIHGLFLMVIFVNLIQEVLLPDYAFFWILVPILLLTYLTAGKQLRVRGRILEVIFPYIFLPLFLVLFLALFQVDYASLPGQLLKAEEGTNGWHDLYGAYGVLMFGQPVEFLLFLLPAFSLEGETGQKERRGKSDGRAVKRKKTGSFIAGAACLFVIIINILMYISTVGMFGTVRTGEKLWSALYIMQSVRLPGRFVERLDILFLVFWIFSAFALFSAYMYYGSRFVKENRRKRYALIWLAGISIFTLVIKEPRTMFEWFVPYKMWIDFPLSFILPLFLYKKREKSTGKKKWKAAFPFILCLLLLTGCQDRADIEDKNYVMSIGVEKGKEKAFKITYEIADLTGSGKEGKERKAKMTAYEADSLKEAEDLNQKRDDKKLDFGHLKVFLFDADLLEEEKDIEKLLKELEGKDSIAGTTLVLFTEDEADKVMEMGGQKAASFGEYVDKMITSQKNISEDTMSKLLRDWAEKRKERSLCQVWTEGDQLVISEQVRMDDQSGTLADQIPKIVRFHIRAVSDGKEDQEKKIRIKDQILPKIQKLLKDAGSKEECMETLEGSISRINQWVQEACKAENYDCSSKTYLCRESFPLKSYGDILLPSGTYDALRIDLGKAEGANWWCMVYPSLCMTDFTEEEENKRNEEEEWEEAEKGVFLLKKKKRYQIRWKLPEFILKIWER